MARNNSTYHLVSLYQPSWVIHRSQSTSISHFFYPGDTDSLGDTIVEAYGDSRVHLTSLGRITGRTRAKGPRPPGENGNNDDDDDVPLDPSERTETS